MRDLSGKTVVVAGGTGNVGTFVVQALLEHGATVAVPSRSNEKLRSLREHLGRRLTASDLSRMVGFPGDIGEEQGADRLVRKIVEEVGEPAAAVATLGQFVPAPSPVEAKPEDLRRVLDNYLLAHFMVARTILPRFKVRGGTYVFVNGPLAFQPWAGSGAGLVSVATAAQQMLFRVVAQELDDSPAQVVELVTYAFIRKRETQPGSPLPAEAVGDYAAYLLSKAALGLHGQSIHLRSPDVLAQAGIDVAEAERADGAR